MILTRYLYPKDSVIKSLYLALAIADKPQANFWAYELFYSGFRKETIELLLNIYTEYYTKESIYPKQQSWFSKLYKNWQDTNMEEDHIIASILENMIRREPDLQKFEQKLCLKIPPQYSQKKYNQKPIFVILKQHGDIAPYQTQFATYVSGWKLPREVCIYQTFPSKHTIQDYVNPPTRWIYYANGSPLWRTRIKKYGGKPNEKMKTIIFPSEDAEEDFRNWFDLEPDEQPKSVQNAWFGTQNPIL